MSRRTNNFFDAPSGAPAPAPVRKAVAASYVEEEPEEVSVPEGPDLSASMHRRGSRPPSAVRASQSFDPSGSGPKPTAPSLGFQAPATSLSAGVAAAIGSRQSPSAVSHDMPRRMAGMSLASEDREPDTGSEAFGRPGAFGARTARGSPGSGAPPPLEPRQPTKPAGFGRRGGAPAEITMEDMEDCDTDGASAGLFAGPTSLRGRQAAVKTLQTEPVPQQTMRAIKELLWGAQGGPPPSWKQGFFFNTKPRLGFGLVQLQGGPCGVLAGVQAHILAALKTSSGLNMNPSASEQQGAVVTAIAELLWQARSGPGVSIAVLPDHDSGARLSHEQLIRGATFVGVTQRFALEDTLRSVLPAYMEQQGWGVVLLLISLMLTRGVHVVRADMDESNNALMGMHGYCTQELVNLILMGKAVSNVFDGDRKLDGSILKGIPAPSRLGLLTLFEWYKYVEVGTHLKNPELPIWVVCSESHFTVLFSADGRAQRGIPPFDLLYYDELANQEDTIRLSVRKDPAGGWTAKVGESFGDRGKCEGQNIPPLECVIETRWPGVSVDWNGSEPIL